MDDRTMAPQQKSDPPASRGEYGAPKIDAVLTPEELEREVHYAGAGTPVGK